MFRTYLTEALDAYGIRLTDVQTEQFVRYYELLIETNAVMNLTAITEPKDVAVKHMADSLSCYDPAYFPQGASVLDLGTGAGFPGIPLAIYRPDLSITLFDSLAKRLRFLETVSRELGLKNVTFLHGRAEDLAHQAEHREQYDIVTSRAVARLQVLAEWALPYVKKGGYCVALKGMQYEEEAQEAKKALFLLGGVIKEMRQIRLPGLDDKRAVLYIQKEKTCPKLYPRKPKAIKEKPLG